MSCLTRAAVLHLEISSLPAYPFSTTEGNGNITVKIYIYKKIITTVKTELDYGSVLFPVIYYTVFGFW